MVDGGQAFPSSSVVHDRAGYDEHIMRDGMSLRDWFAGQALANLAATHAEVDAPCGKRAWQPDVIARWAYQLADAMLQERSK